MFCKALECTQKNSIKNDFTRLHSKVATVAAAVEFAARGASGCKRQSLALGRQRALSLQKILE
jgi:hypothetical protein